MKKIIAFIAIYLCGVGAQAQSLPLDPESKKIKYEETVQNDSLTKAVLYQRAQEWMIKFYKSEQFDVRDAEAAKVKRDGSFEIKLTYDFKYKSLNNVSYSILIGCKEGKYRYTITDFRFYNKKSGANAEQPLEAAYAKMSTQNKNETNAQVAKEVQLVIDDLKKYLATGLIKDKEDW